MARCVGVRIISRNYLRLAALVFGSLLVAGALRAADQASFSRLELSPNQVVVTGQFAPGKDWQVVKFSSTVKGRYFCLEALSSQDGGSQAAVAELQMLDATGEVVPDPDWKVVFTDSEERQSGNGAATNAIDRNPATCWHTETGPSASAFPHRLIVDLGRSVGLTGFRYLPSQSEGQENGRIKDYQVSLGDDLVQAAPRLDWVPQNVYLFSHFTDLDQTGLHLSWSGDGYQWEPLNSGVSIFSPPMWGTNLLRDPCLLSCPDGVFRMVWTCAWTGTSVGYAASKDLIHWFDVKALPVMAGEPDTVNCWAPEIYWDEKCQEYVIIWASAVRNHFTETLGQIDETDNQRIYGATTKDFKTFTPTRLFYDPGCAAIDATIFPAKGRWHLFFKDETGTPLRKNIRIAEADDLQGPFAPPGPPFSPPFAEGPAVFSVGEDTVCIFHYYDKNTWGAMKSRDLKTWSDVTERLNLPAGSHPGTVLQVPREILLALWQAHRAEIGPAPEAADLGLGHWIWTDAVEDKQTCRLWRAFEVPEGELVSLATLRITADNGYRLFLDGRELGRGGDYNDLTEYNLTQLLTPGRHVLAVEGFNDALAAGVVLGLQIQMFDGKKMQVLSDPSWLVVPGDEKNWTSRRQPKDTWKRARIVGFAGKFEWVRPKRVLSSPPLVPQPIYFWQRGWFLASLLSLCALGAFLSIRQGVKLTVQTRSHKLLERERDRIARDIHDDLGAGLTQLTLLGELVLRETPAGAATRKQLDSLCGKSRALLGTMDELVWTVNSRRDTVQDFAAFVCEHAQEFLASTPIRCRLDVPEHLPPTPMDLPARRNLLLAVKEAVRNIARHSGATELLLQIRVEDEKLVVALEDNGHGFVATVPSTRNGLRNMSERLSDIGGDCQITTAPGKGCKVVFTLPLRPRTFAKNWLRSWPGALWRREERTDSSR